MSLEQNIGEQIRKGEKVVTGTYKKFFYDFQQFMFANNVLVAATGFCVGVATKEVIEKLLNMAVLPVIKFMTKFSLIKILYNKLLENTQHAVLKNILQIGGDVVWAVLQWIVIIVMTFVILEYLLNRNIIGLSSTIKSDERLDFAKAKAEAKESIIPTQKEVNALEKTDKIEKQTGEIVKELEDKKMRNISKKAPTTLESFYASPLI